MNQKFAAGMRVLIRDAEWLVKRVKSADDGTALGQYELTCIGISNLVRGQEKHFLSGYEDEIRILRPEETKLVRDDSKRFVKSKLFIEALLRRTPATDAKIHIAQNAAMDVLPYQLKPAVDALEATRPRMLIADAVGIGKTLEAGILVSELIARGRGKRILVLTVKAMLEQFQKELGGSFRLTPQVRGFLKSYSWPGNIRELENVLENAVALSESELIYAEHIHLEGTAPAPLTLKERLKREERQILRQTLAQCGGSRVKAMELLGLSKTVFYGKLKEYQLD